MSDLGDLHGIFPTSIRWNAEEGILGISVFNPETGEREIQEIELGAPATFAMDLATRVRGYGLIRVGLYDMKLTPVGTPPPPRPDDDEYKPALGCWLWNPAFGELRLETNGAIARQAITAVWDEARFEPQAVAGLQPVVCFAGSTPVFIKPVNKMFFGPIIKTVGWVERNQVPGWADRAPTVAPPKTLAALPTTNAAPAIETKAKAPDKAEAKAKADPKGRTPGAVTITSGRQKSAIREEVERRRPDLKQDLNDGLDDLPFDK
jgi:hypothetical protein